MINPTQRLSTISSELVRRLRLPITYLNEYRICYLKIGSLTDEQLRLEAHVLISKDLPTRPYEQDISDEIRKRFDHLVLADPSFNRKDRVMITLGADIYPRIIKSGIFHPCRPKHCDWMDFNWNHKLDPKYCKAAGMFILNKHIPALSSYILKSERRTMQE